ncbi:hypothetical protein SynSYN20_01707 [Synechococcus sp. SYN20]|nr:hypothetical protein SynSYN20_01707 [Synechococcus sp. SYN20]
MQALPVSSFIEPTKINRSSRPKHQKRFEKQRIDRLHPVQVHQSDVQAILGQ